MVTMFIKSPVTTRIIATTILCLLIPFVCSAADVVRILPFTYDTSRYLPDMAREAVWLFQKKLEIGRIKSILSTGSVPTDTPMTPLPTKLNPASLGDLSGVNLIMAGSLTDLEIDRKAGIRGARVLGVCEIPVVVTIHVGLYDAGTGSLVSMHERTAKQFVPRIKVLGLHRHPYPTTPRSIDGLMHDVIVEITREIVNSRAPSEVRLDLFNRSE